MPGEEEQAGQDVTELQSQLTAMREELEGLKGKNTELEKSLADSKDKLFDPAILEFLTKDGGEGDGKTPPAREEEDFDLLSNKELVARLEERRASVIEEARKQFDERFASTESAIANMQARLDLELTFIRHPDFKEGWSDKDYRERFLAVVRENPTWNCEKAYRQLKLEGLEQAQQEKQVAAARKEAERQAFTEKGGIPASTTTKKAPSLEEAVEMAFEQFKGD